MKVVDIIKYEGNNTTFVWKHHCEDFNTLSQLIVHESQEALFFLNGEALDLFGPGRHTLHTQNIPLLSRLMNTPTGGVSPFHCEVYFINKVEQMAIDWGIGNVNFLDPTHNNYAFKIGANGEMSLRVSDSRKLITKLVGTETSLSQETLKKYFNAPIAAYIRTFLPSLIREKCISIFDIESYLIEYGDVLKSRISREMEDYGICLEKLWINSILMPESDPFYITLNRQRGEKITLVNQGELDMRQAEYCKNIGLVGHVGEVEKRRMNVDIQKYEQDSLGFSYQQKESFEVMKRMAENEGSGSDLGNAAMGIGMGVSAGGAFGEIKGGMTRNILAPSYPTVPAPSGSEAAQVTSNLNAQMSIAEDDMTIFKKKIKKLKMMYDEGLISQEKFEQESNRLLAEI